MAIPFCRTNLQTIRQHANCYAGSSQTENFGTHKLQPTRWVVSRYDAVEQIRVSGQARLFEHDFTPASLAKTFFHAAQRLSETLSRRNRQNAKTRRVTKAGRIEWNQLSHQLPNVRTPEQQCCVPDFFFIASFPNTQTLSFSAYCLPRSGSMN